MLVSPGCRAGTRGCPAIGWPPKRLPSLEVGGILCRHFSSSGIATWKLPLVVGLKAIPFRDISALEIGELGNDGEGQGRAASDGCRGDRAREDLIARANVERASIHEDLDWQAEHVAVQDRRARGRVVDPDHPARFVDDEEHISIPEHATDRILDLARLWAQRRVHRPRSKCQEAEFSPPSPRRAAPRRWRRRGSPTGTRRSGRAPSSRRTRRRPARQWAHPG